MELPFRGPRGQMEEEKNHCFSHVSTRGTDSLTWISQGLVHPLAYTWHFVHFEVRLAWAALSYVWLL